MSAKPTPEQVREWAEKAHQHACRSPLSYEKDYLDKFAELAAQWALPKQQQTAEPGFWLSTEFINDFVVNSLKDLIRRAKWCSICDVDLRENGKNVRFEADWIKYMEWREASPNAQQTTVEEPELPETEHLGWSPDGKEPRFGYTAAQMHDHYAAGVRAGMATVKESLTHQTEATGKQRLQVPTGWAAPKDQYAVPVLFNPYTGEPRDVRDVQSDPQGILIVPPGKVNLLAAMQGGQQP